MTTKSLFILFTLFTSVAMTEAQNNTSKMFEKFSSNKDITSVIITKSMLNLIPVGSDANMNGLDLKKLSDRLEQVEIYTSEKSNACKSFGDEMNIIQKDKSFELLMSMNGKDENMDFFAQKNGDKIKELIMYMNKPNKCVIVRIVGSFTSEDIKKITKDVK